MIAKRAVRYGYTHLKLVPRLPELMALEGWYGNIKLSCRFNDLLRILSTDGMLSAKIRFMPAMLCGDPRVMVAYTQSNRGSGRFCWSCVVVLTAPGEVTLLPFDESMEPVAFELFKSKGYAVSSPQRTSEILRRFNLPPMKDLLHYKFLKGGVPDVKANP